MSSLTSTAAIIHTASRTVTDATCRGMLCCVAVCHRTPTDGNAVVPIDNN